MPFTCVIVLYSTLLMKDINNSQVLTLLTGAHIRRCIHLHMYCIYQQKLTNLTNTIATICTYM